MLNSVKFDCNIITPMFLNGADGSTPEIRPTAIKASMRFWWRAANGHLGKETLYKEEGKIFGDTSQRSNVLITIVKTLNSKKNDFPLPHKSESKANCFPESQNDIFSIKLALANPTNAFETEKLKSLFTLSSLLGGLGKRSRRGFGSIKLSGENVPDGYFSFENILKYLNNIVYSYPIPNTVKFKLDGNIIKPVDNSKDKKEFPYILSIQKGKENITLKNIGQATHDVMGVGDTRELYMKTVGNGRPRLASPIYISYLPDNVPVVTKLFLPTHTNLSLQNQLIHKIVN